MVILTAKQSFKVVILSNIFNIGLFFDEDNLLCLCKSRGLSKSKLEHHNRCLKLKLD